MSLGQKIKRLRIEKGLTQKDLADQVHVTFQTVSKWENDENEPDLNTIKTISKIFGVTTDYLINEEAEVQKEEKEVVPTSVEPQTTTVNVVHHYQLHTCARCHKEIPENELVSKGITRSERHGRTHRTVVVGTNYYHKACLDLINKEQADLEEKKRKAKALRSKKLSFGWGIAGGTVALVASLLIFLLVPACQENIHPALAVLFSVLISYGIFSMLYCIITGSYIGEVFVWCAGRSIRLPGIIFSWDIDGVVWAITMKLVLAVLGFLFGVFTLLFGIALSSALSMVSFPFILIHNIHNDYADAL